MMVESHADILDQQFWAKIRKAANAACSSRRMPGASRAQRRRIRHRADGEGRYRECVKKFC